MNAEETLEWESESREGRYVFLERAPDRKGARFQVRVEGRDKLHKWDYFNRDKAWALLERLRLGRRS